ncbi:SDR family NAD(P)-dependent oxidoreductase [Streptomyces sp. NPDC046977]|uniref:SDR family NAD(P)-dependent oxidoreductase n=1 Tax=Streptomyces sp. NPDC046977 TaxID=3154703 RepID=UPI0033E724E5
MHSPVQQPIGSGFTAASTIDDVIAGIDLTGRTAIVTGGYSGIGIETTRALAAAGAQVIIPARDVARAQKSLAGALGPVTGVEVVAMDLMDPASIDRFTGAFLESGRALDILVNSAGIMAAPLARDARGFESHFATNHLGHFQLTTRLLPALRRAEKGARVVNVAAMAHRLSPVVFDDLHFERRGYDPLMAYAQSKTANILFTVELDRRERDAGVRAFALHPGAIFTPLSRHVSQEVLLESRTLDENGKPVIDPASGRKTPAQGASTSVWCATSPQLAGLGGLYCENNEVSPLLDPVDGTGAESADGESGGVDTDAAAQGYPVGVAPHAVDPDAATRLWELSEKLVTHAR